MNNFVNEFGERIAQLWLDVSGGEQQASIRDVKIYADKDPEAFLREEREIRYQDADTLMIIMEALATDTDRWSQYFVDLIDDVFTTAQRSATPKEILLTLADLPLLEREHKPYVRQIAERIHHELHSSQYETRIAAIYALPSFLHNPTIRNSAQMIDSLHELLHDPDRRIRAATFASLGFEKLLPAGYKPSLKDRLLMRIYRTPTIY